MAFALGSKSTLVESLASVAKSEIEALIVGMQGAEQGVDERVHETRKGIKRLRALLRLYRAGLGHALFQLEDGRLRELGRSLGQVRDASVLCGSLDALVLSAGAPNRAELADHLPTLSNALSDGPRATESEVTAHLRRVHDGLGTIRERAGGWMIDRNGWSAIAPGLRRTYARGRRALESATHRASEKRLHDFRIDVKRHQYQLTFLEPLWPEPVKAFRHEAQRLGELLGQDHDLSLLERRFETLGGRPDLLPLARPFRAAVEHRHAALRREALDLGARVYAESPGRFTARYREYFDAWL